MKSYKFARRSFLTGLGSASLLLPLLRSIEGQAQGLPGPVRFLVVHHPTGTVRDSWVPSVNGQSFTLNRISAPFEPLRQHMVVIDGVTLPVAAKDGLGSHEGGMAALMTGQTTFGIKPDTVSDYIAQGPSIDQLFLKQSSLLGGTPFGSLELAADNRSDRDEIATRVMSYETPSQAGERLPRFPSIRPIEVYNRIFGSAVPGASTADLTQLRAERKSVLDFMLGDLARLRTLVPAGETVKLDAHAEAIRKLEISLDQGAVVLPNGCLAPAAPATFADNPEQFYANQPTNHPHAEVGQLQLGLIRAAFACDLVRTGTFMWAPGTTNVVFGGLFPGMEVAAHHSLSHDTDEGIINWLVEIDLWYAQQTSLAIQQFANTPDPLGTGSLLDNTVVVAVSEIGRAYDHDFDDLPLMVFGGPGVKIQGNRMLSLSPRRPMNDVWMALAGVFGVNLPSLGEPQYYTGALPGLVG